MKHKNFAVVLAGCGVNDGSEIHEAVLTLLAIDKTGSAYQCFAPDVNQYHVINHLNGNSVKESRNVLIEAARIARSDIKKLSEFNPKNFDAIIFPGGFGVAKNLFTYAIDGPDCLVNPETEECIYSAREAGLPIGAICISPLLITRVLGIGTVTIGNDITTANSVESLGGTHLNSERDDIVIDKENKIVSTPAYMLNSPISVVAKGIEKLVNALYDLM
ncbi:MAG: isoprenoid biosynthesis glyoxalase ElbB [Prolixibacteraceae bacterium]|nr:isoprenoid biosynthesis glyoxalase ElbB [Prolixibacteraceae bacterium]